MKRGVGKNNSSPHLVLLIPLHQNVDIGVLKDNMKQCAESENNMPIFGVSKSTGFTINISRFKYRYQVNHLFVKFSFQNILLIS